MLAVPATTLTLCDALRQLESHTWCELEAGYQERQRLDEESVTSYHLMRLARAVPAVVIEKHSRQRESRTGADWEFWVGRPGAYVGFRVQAKILNAASIEYSSLYKSDGKAMEQVNKLIHAAEHTGRGTFPLYAFYNYWLPYSGAPTSWACPRTRVNARSAGWTIASAYEVAHHLSSHWRSKKLRDLSHIMYPVSCLFCCDCDRQGAHMDGASLASAVRSRVANRWEASEPPILMEQGPAYVERLFKRRLEKEVAPEPSSRDQQAEFPPGIRRVMLIRDLA